MSLPSPSPSTSPTLPNPSTSTTRNTSPTRLSSPTTTTATSSSSINSSTSTVSSRLSSLIQDLIQTERHYLNDLSFIIKTLAGQFTPQHLPPPLLDQHFRLAECFYRSHKPLINELNQLLQQQQQSSNDDGLLTCFYQFDYHFSNQLETLYHRYCSAQVGWSAKANWNRILSSHDLKRLNFILNQSSWPGSIPKPPLEIFPGCPYSSDQLYVLIKEEGQDSFNHLHPTLLTLFALPFARLVYYSRLYHKVISLIIPPNHHHHQNSSNQNHGSLLSTARRISSLLDSGSLLWNVPASSNSSLIPPNLHNNNHNYSQPSSNNNNLNNNNNNNNTNNNNNNTMVQITPGIFVQQAVLELERTLDTSRCLDIFTMSPKPCKLHMAPPDLAFSRTIRLSANASFHLCPKSNPSTQIHTPNGFLILLTDLLLFCEKSPHPNSRPFLMYPPLATKHLCVSPHLQNASQFDILILRKETISVTVSSHLERDRWLLVLAEAIRHANPRTTDLIPTANAFPPKLKMNTLDLSRSASPSPISAIRPRPLPTNPPIDDLRSAHQLSNPPPSEQLPASRRPSPIEPAFTRPSAPDISTTSPPPHQQQLRSYQLTDQPSLVAPLAFRTDHQRLLPSRSIPPHSASSSRPSSPQHSSYGSESQRPINPASSPRFLRKAPSAHTLGQPLPSDPRRAPPLPLHTTGLNPALTVPHLTSSGALGASIGRPKSTDPASSASERHYRSPSSAVFDKSNDHHAPGRLPSLQPLAAPSARFPPSGSAEGSQRSSAVSYGSASIGAPPPPPVFDPHINDEDNDEDDDDDGDSLSGSRDRERLKPKLEPTLLTSMKTKIFLKQSHAQWKSLGTGKLLVFNLNPTNGKQLVVEQDDKKQKGKTIISTMVLSDGIERVGRTGVAVDLSDESGRRTGIVYMLQLKTETSAMELFEQLLQGSDRRPST